MGNVHVKGVEQERSGQTEGPSSRARHLLDWQRRFYSSACVWIVHNSENLYETRETAMFEVEWRRARGERVPDPERVPVHTHGLAWERWSGPLWGDPGDAGGTMKEKAR
jgi:hypothetical protein